MIETIVWMDRETLLVERGRALGNGHCWFCNQSIRMKQHFVSFNHPDNPKYSVAFAHEECATPHIENEQETLL